MSSGRSKLTLASSMAVMLMLLSGSFSGIQLIQNAVAASPQNPQVVPGAFGDRE